MARTGLIRMGLASAGIDTQAVTRANTEAEKRAQAVQDRVERFAAGDTSTKATSGLKSLVGGLGAASIAGGPAGLLVFGLSQVMSKKRREGIAAYRSHLANNAQDSIERTDAAVAHLVSLAETDEEKAQAKFFQAEYENLKGGLESPDPQAVVETVLALQDFTGTLDDEYDQWLTRETARDKDDRARFEADRLRADDIYDTEQKNGARYIATVEAFQKMSELSRQGTNIGDTALIYALADVIMPGEIKTDEDIKGLQNSSLVSEQMLAKFSETLGGGGKLHPDTRREMLDVARSAMRIQMNAQRQRNDRAVERARDEKLPEVFYNNVQIPVPDSLRSLVVPSGKADPNADNNRTAGGGAGPSSSRPDELGPVDTFTPAKPLGAGGVLHDMGVGWTRFWTDVDMRSRGEQFLVDDEGNRVIQDRHGNRRPHDTLSEWVNADGDLIRRHETDSGPVFENVTRNEQMRKDARQAEREANREPGLWQEGGFFDRRRQRREADRQRRRENARGRNNPRTTN